MGNLMSNTCYINFSTIFSNLLNKCYYYEDYYDDDSFCSTINDDPFDYLNNSRDVIEEKNVSVNIPQSMYDVNWNTYSGYNNLPQSMYDVQNIHQNLIWYDNENTENMEETESCS